MIRTAFALTTAMCLFLLTGSASAEEPQLPIPVLDRIGRLPDELIKAKKTDSEIVDALFLATLTRLPTEAEKEKALKHITSTKDRKTASLHLAWALVNSKEFLKLHGLDKNLVDALRLLNKHTEDWGKEKKEEK